ncbi:DUF4113 domain-containing protein [Vibrio sp. Makdt]|uniref:DUF4113 domain-containing protein n=1 Tax=Vibrio sp. Makdt TaxID=2998828 RepID=UPI003FCDCC86
MLYTVTRGEGHTNRTSFQAIAKHAAIASAKARKQQSLAMTMTVFASTSSFDKEPHYSKSVTIKLAYPTADAGKIVAAATNAAKQIFRPNVRFYKVGVGLTELTTAKYEQTDLINQNPNNKSLMTVLDGLNTRFGRDTLFLAAQGIQEKWEMRRSMLTPQYTTNWKDLPKLKCS